MRTVKGLEAVVLLIMNILLGLTINAVTTGITIFCVRHLFEIEWGDKFWIVFLFLLLIKGIFGVGVKTK